MWKIQEPTHRGAHDFIASPRVASTSSPAACNNASAWCDSRFLVAGVNQKELGKLPSRITITVLLMQNHATTHARNQQQFASISQLLHTKTKKTTYQLIKAPVPIDPVRAMR